MKNFIKNFINSKTNYKFFIKNFTQLTDLKIASYVAKSMRHSLIINPYENKKKLTGNTIIFSPHPDDEIIGLGGTIIKLIKDRSKLHCIYFSTDRERIKEYKTVSKLLNFSTTQLNLKINNFAINNKNLDLIAKEINLRNPKRIFLPFLFDDHDDHRRVNQFLLELFKKKLILKKDFEVWGYQIYSFFPTNLYVDITKNIKNKIFYLKKYKSQVKKKNFVHLVLSMNAYNSRFINTSKKLYLENFFVVPSKEYFKLCEKYFKTPRNCYYNKNYY